MTKYGGENLQDTNFQKVEDGKHTSDVRSRNIAGYQDKGLRCV
jgi:hypothetical protein